MDMIQFPIQFDSTGIKKLKDGAPDYYAQLLSIAMLTEPLTHPFSPDFGASDPAFRTIDKGLFVLNAARFVPEVQITKIEINPNELNDENTRVTLSFEIKQR